MLPLFLSQKADAQTITGTIQHEGIQRDYRLHLPPNFDTSEELPLVFNLHGYTSNATEQEFYSEMNAVADTARFIVCYPNGLNNAWNVGFLGTADDLGFLNALIDVFHADYDINLTRVYSCGMSNGGFMSYLLACELNDRIAAVASVTGSMTTGMLDNCQPERPVPALEIHGTADPVVAYNGSAFNLGVEDVFDFWVGENACPGSPDTTAYPDIATNDQSTAQRITFADCEENSEVILIKVQDGGHTWPGAPINVGVTCQDLEASVEIWNFFNRFSLAIPLKESESLQTGHLLASPNPFFGELNLRQIPVAPTEVGGTATLQRIAILDATGREVWQIMHPSPELSIEIDWQPGVYFLVAESSEGEVFTQKLVKL